LQLGAGCTEPDAVARVLGSPLVAHLTRFDTGEVEVTNEAARDVAAAAHLRQLRELALSRGVIGDTAVAALAGAKHLAGLRVLRLRLGTPTGTGSDQHVTTTGIRTLANSAHLTHLTTLDLRGQRLTDEAARLILTGPAFARLETVSFWGSPLTARAFDVPAGRLRLRDVNLSQCVIGDAAATALAALPQFSEVGRLNLRSCDLGPKALAALARSPMRTSLCELDLADNPLRTHGLDGLTQGRWPELHTLNLSSCGLAPDAVKALAGATGIKRLLDFDLSGNDVGAGGAIAITKAGWASTLVRLNLARCRCAAGAVLAATPRLRDLQQLDLTDNPLNPAGVAALMEAEWPAAGSPLPRWSCSSA
jgi:hypothetical protein